MINDDDNVSFCYYYYSGKLSGPNLVLTGELSKTKSGKVRSGLILVPALSEDGKVPPSELDSMCRQLHCQSCEL